MGFLENKRILICGLISDRSIAYGIAEACHRAGAKLAFTYQNERFKERVITMAQQWGSNLCFQCDITKDDEIAATFSQLSQHWDGLEGLVHSIAFAPADQLEGDYIDHVNREGFKIAHDVSSYSFSALAKAALPLMQGRQSAMVTLTYLGSIRVLDNYNVMGVAKASLEANMRYMAYSLGPRGVRVNAISAGPIRTLAASGIKGFRKILEHHEQVAPLRQLTTIEQVGNTCAFLCSDLASGITGDILYVDGGYHIR